jgi:hypothetical protein
MIGNATHARMTAANPSRTDGRNNARASCPTLDGSAGGNLICRFRGPVLFLVLVRFVMAVESQRKRCRGQRAIRVGYAATLFIGCEGTDSRGLRPGIALGNAHSG